MPTKRPSPTSALDAAGVMAEEPKALLAGERGSTRAAADVASRPDLGDSEAETERLDSSPLKRRRNSHTEQSPGKRGRYSAPTDDTPAQVHSGNGTRGARRNGHARQDRRHSSDPDEEDDDSGADFAAGSGPTQLPSSPAALSDIEAGPANSAVIPENARNGHLETAEGSVVPDMDASEGLSEGENDSDAEDEPQDGLDEQDAINDEEYEGDEKEHQRRQDAVKFLTEIEIQFASFRDQMHDDQIARFDLEIHMCGDGTHPELEKIYESLRERRQERVDRIRCLLDYQMECIGNQTRAMRAQIHQQFLKDRVDLRSDLLHSTTGQWYQVNYERRAADKLVPDFGYRAEPVRHIPDSAWLAKVSKFVGYPAAPQMAAVSDHELNEDLTALGLR